MKFPGKRKSKHYFPVNARDPLLQQFQPENETSAAWVVGIDQTLVDIEAKVDDEFIERYGLSAGHSLVIEDDVAEALYQELKQKNLITHQFAGGTIGNTMHNYSVLADDRSVLLGVMCSNIEIGSYAYRYLCNTSSRTDLNYLQGVDGPIGRCFTLIGESGERTFAISPGHMNQLRAESIPEDVIAGASALVLTSYLVRCKPGEPMPEATMKAIEYAKKYNVPVVLTLGTRFVIDADPQWWREFIAEYVTVLAMNEDVNVLVFDTEVYSNTGGQSSKSTPTAAIAKFAASGKKTKKKEAQRLPLSLSSLQVLAGRRYGYTPQQVLDTAQELYERKLTTYPRSDCEYLPVNQRKDVPHILANLGKLPAGKLAEWVAGADGKIRSRAWNDSKITAHHAIIPTTVACPFDKLTSMQQHIYYLVAQAYIAQFYPIHEYDQTRMVIEAADERFVAHGKTVTVPGWKVLYQSDKHDDDEEEKGTLPAVRKGDGVHYQNGQVDKKATKPPPRFTPSTLLAAMKEIYKYVKDESLKKKLKEELEFVMMRDYLSLAKL